MAHKSFPIQRNLCFPQQQVNIISPFDLIPEKMLKPGFIPSPFECVCCGKDWKASERLMPPSFRRNDGSDDKSSVRPFANSRILFRGDDLACGQPYNCGFVFSFLFFFWWDGVGAKKSLSGVWPVHFFPSENNDLIYWCTTIHQSWCVVCCQLKNMR